MNHRAPLRPTLVPLLAALLTACASAPPVQPPALEAGEHFKETPPGWIAAAPADTLDRGPWWTLFNDATLNALAERVQVNNQNIAAAVAAFEQARGLAREQQASLLPQAGLTGGATRSGGGSRAAVESGGTGEGFGNGNNGGTRYQLGVQASWTVDVWGRLRGTANAAAARAQASEADLAAARLSAIGQLATSYFSLREADAEAELMRATITGYERALQIAQNRYAVGVAQKSDVLQAQTQLANARADLAQLQRQRAQAEHAIAVLVGDSPSRFSLAPAPWDASRVPAVPVGLPSTLLLRRPDVAAAERQVAAANAQIGVARAAYFPNFTLNASDSSSASRIADLLKSSANVWSLGVSVAQVLFDAGAGSARVDEAKAAWQQASAQYRQTALQALQAVEDQLVAARTLEEQQALQREASQAADQTEAEMMNRYRAGLVSYSEVVQAQASALSARRALLQAGASRQTAAVALIQALGGGWTSGPR
jgi:NodT family efflux transporter outer membrane factor (OMF) lipoprotein